MTRHTRTSALLAALAVAAAPSLGAQTPQAPQTAPAAAPAQRITFDEAIAIALRQNVAVRQAENAAAVQGAAVDQQKLQFLPNLSLNVSGANDVGRSFNQSEGVVLNQATQSLSTGVSSSVTLFDGLRNVSNLRQARLGEAASEQDLARARQTAVFTVASNFLALVTRREQLRVQEEALGTQQALAAQIQRLVDAGTRPISDLYQQQATVAAARSALVEARRTLALAEVDLLQTLQLDASRTYDFVAPAIGAASAAAPTYDLPTLIATATARRADLAAEGSRVEAAEQGVRAATASRWPTVSVTAGYNTGFNTANDLAFAEQLDQRRGGSIGIGVSIPLFDRGATSLAAQRARIAEENAELALQARRQEVALEVRRAYLDYQAAQERLAAAAAQRRAAEQAATVSQQRYQLGAATLVELAQARTSQVQAASAEVGARYEVAFQQALMSYYTGELDPRQVPIGG
jgi:outer membrane protein